MAGIKEFVATLAAQENTATLFNPYLNPDLAANLLLYLDSVGRKRGPRVLLVGEAPGYKGCVHTGIPFSCGAILDRFDHPLLTRLKRDLKIAVVESENTATIVWEYLAERKVTPLFWNAFPFHPHPSGDRKSNRAPNASELAAGLPYLQQLGEIYCPAVIAGVGNKGYQSAVRAFPGRQVRRIRHPSFGGKSGFISGMDELYARI